MDQDTKNLDTSRVTDNKGNKDSLDDLFLDEPLVMSVQDVKEAAKLAKQEERWQKREEKQARKAEKKEQKEQQKWEKTQKENTLDIDDKVGVSNWFVTICLTNIPVVNVLYLLCVCLNKNKPQPKRSFAIAFILYRILVWILAFTLIYVLLMFGTDFVDGIMSFLADYNLL